MENWLEFTQQRFDQSLMCQICRHKPTNTDVVIKKVRIPSQMLEQQLSIYKWRMEAECHIFKVLHFEYQREQKDYKVLKVYIEKHNLTLEDIHQLSLSEALYVLQNSLFTIQRLAIEFGYFSITDNMIGFIGNKSKIWVNSKYQLNEIMRPSINEAYMIKDILQIINRHSSKEFQDQIIKNVKKCNSFLKMHEFLWRFSFEEKILIPPQLFSLSIRMDQRKIKKRITLNNNKQNFEKLTTKRESRRSSNVISSKTSLGCYDRSASNDNYSKKNNKITKSVYFAENNCKQSNLSAVDNERKLSINHHLSLSCEFNLLFVPQLQNSFRNKHPISHNMKAENVLKMRSRIMEKMKKKNSPSSTVQCLSYLGTVKSFGDIEQEVSTPTSKLFRLSQYGKDIQKSLFQIQEPTSDKNDSFQQQS